MNTEIGNCMEGQNACGAQIKYSRNMYHVSCAVIQFPVLESTRADCLLVRTYFEAGLLFALHRLM